jgi:secondary thiamine-phosphate synthase enzyme
MIVTELLSVYSQGSGDSVNITDQVQNVVDKSGVQEGSVLVFYRHTTGALLVIEHEAGIFVDLENIFDKIVPVNGMYNHHLRGYDENGAAHLKTALLNVSIVVPILDGHLLLGKYQEILMLDMDVGAKLREIVVQVNGD